MKAYLFEYIDIHSKDGLIQAFYSKASDDVRSRGVFWMSQLFGESKQGKDTVLWGRIWDLWQWRIQSAVENEGQGEFSKELSDYLRILPSVPLNLGELYDTLKTTFGFMKSRGFDIGNVLKYLAEQSEEFTNLAVDLLHEIIVKFKDFYILPENRENIKTILDRAQSTSDETEEKVIEIVNTFGERGDYSWRPWLEREV